jgi:hypothetical protein
LVGSSSQSPQARSPLPVQQTQSAFHPDARYEIKLNRELVYRPLQFQKRGQDFFGGRYKTLSIVAMCFSNPIGGIAQFY